MHRLLKPDQLHLAHDLNRAYSFEMVDQMIRKYIKEVNNGIHENPSHACSFALPLHKRIEIEKRNKHPTPILLLSSFASCW